MASTLSPEVQLMRRRVRHIHIPDLPPIYAPRSLAHSIREHIVGQITRQRALGEEPPRPEGEYGFAKITSRVQTSFSSWLQRAGPPPTVLSFTRRPTYILPKHQVETQEPWKVEYLMKALKSRVNINFPEPPGWSSSPWRPSWEQKLPVSEWKHDPLNHQWPDVGVLIMPCAEAMFLGPGQLSIWPIMDLEDAIQLGGAKVRTKYEFERILEDTTIELLKREFKIQAFAIPGSSGVWVESRIPPAELDARRSGEAEARNASDSLSGSPRRRNLRRIATIHASVTDDITQWGVSIHVGQPDPGLNAWARSTNPWTPLRQHDSTTSIAAELCYTDSCASPLGPSRYLQTYFDQNRVPLRAGQGHIPYSRIKADSGRRSPAPLGMDNRDISAAWTYQLARELGMGDGHVDHYSMVDENDADATPLPTRHTEAGFRFRGVFSEDVMSSTYRQVDVPSIQVGRNEAAAPGIAAESLRIENHDGRVDARTHEGWLLSWPLWQATLTRKLDEAVGGGPGDTRRRAHELQKQASSRLQRRRTELRQKEEAEEGWRRDRPQLIRRPLTDAMVRELAERSREMEAVLKTVRIGRKSQRLLDSTVQMRRLLESRFAGALRGSAGAGADPGPEEEDPFSLLEKEATRSQKVTKPEKEDPFSSLEKEAISQKAAEPEKEDPFTLLEEASRPQKATEAAQGKNIPETRDPPASKAPTAQADMAAGGKPNPPAGARGRQGVDLTDTKAARREARQQRREEKFRAHIAKLQGRVADRVTLARPPGEDPARHFAELAATRAERLGAEREARPLVYKRLDVVAVPRGPAQFLPGTHQIGAGAGPEGEEGLPKTQQVGGGGGTPSEAGSGSGSLGSECLPKTHQIGGGGGGGGGGAPSEAGSGSSGSEDLPETKQVGAGGAVPSEAASGSGSSVSMDLPKTQDVGAGGGAPSEAGSGSSSGSSGSGDLPKTQQVEAGGAAPCEAGSGSGCSGSDDLPETQQVGGGP